MVIEAEFPSPASTLGPLHDADAYLPLDGQKKPFVLLIEDNPGDVLLIEEALRESGIDCDLTVVGDGEEAMGLFRTIDADPNRPSPNLVLLDLNLPKRSGHEILGGIRRSTRCPTIPVIVVTSSQAESDIAKASRLGIAAYFRKPASLAEFMKLGALVRNWL